MADYKDMYFKLFRATEEAINILIKAQKECEELYIEGTNDAPRLISLLDEIKNKNGNNSDEPNS